MGIPTRERPYCVAQATSRGETSDHTLGSNDRDPSHLDDRLVLDKCETLDHNRRPALCTDRYED